MQYWPWMLENTNMEKKEELGKTQLGLLHKQCLTLLFRGIRFYESKFENDVKHKQASPTPQETLFLNNLHSSQKERLDKWWLKGKPYWASGIKLDPKDLDQVIIKEHIHELELKSIQDWIKRLSDARRSLLPLSGRFSP